jgi:hypothetical protein
MAKTLTPELSRRLARLGQTPYMQVNKPELPQYLLNAFFEAKTEAELPDEIKQVIELCDLSGEIAVRERSDDDAAIVALMMQELRDSGRFEEFFGEGEDEELEPIDEDGDGDL